MINDFLIRQAIDTDIERLAAIEVAAAAAFPAERIPDPNSSFPPDRLTRSLNEGLLFIAEVDGQIVGFSTSSIVNGYLHLEEISVHPNYGKRGIGTALVGRVVAESRSRLLFGVTLTTFSDFPWNAPFYKKLGFSRDIDLPAHVKTRLRQETALGMTNRVGMMLSNDA